MEPAIEGRLVCSKCIIQFVTDKKRQHSRRYPHGLVTEPIPSHSHLFGGSWYEEGVKKWGEPPADIILYALRYQEEARREEDTLLSPLPLPSLPPLPSKVASSHIPNKPTSRQMPRPKRATTAPTPTPSSDPIPPTLSSSSVPKKPIGRPRKKKEEDPPQNQELSISEEIPMVATSPKKIRRPRVSKKSTIPLSESMEPILSSSTTPVLFHVSDEEANKPQETSKPKEESKPEEATKPKRAPRKRASSTQKKDLPPPPPSSVVFEKDSCIPTLYEEAMEEHTLSDYETENVYLTLFTLDSVTYFRDANKNKLYRRIKEKTLGPYVGRYDPFTETLVTDVPDSDDEE